MKNNTRSYVRVFFLLAIFALWQTNKIEFWLVVLLAGMVATPFLGRVYCGWVCPIFTTLDIFSPIIKSPLLKKYNRYFENRFFKITIFILFLIAFFLTKKLDFAVPFFILLIPLGLLVTVLFGSAKWHGICPFGTIFNIPARFSTQGYQLISQDCSKCGLCIKKCENNCRVFGAGKTINNEKKNCLICGKCKDVCPQDNILYGKLHQSKSSNQGGAVL